MSDANLLSLGDRCGIAHEYHDIWGGHHTTSSATRRDLLAAMHFPREAVEKDPAGLLSAIEEAAWRHPLPPVMVVRVDTPLTIPFVQPVADGNLPWEWTVALESGSSISGSFQPADLPVEAHHGTLVRRTLELAALATPGYHRLELHNATGRHAMPLVVVPQQCYKPPALANEGRVWGITAQLYGVRSARNWGIGDFTDLGDLLAFTAQAGGQVVGVNPLHALFPDNPAHISPYSPSQRSFVDVLYIDVEAVPEFTGCKEAQRRVAGADFQARLAGLRNTAWVDYPGVAAAKFEILELLFAHFRKAGGARATNFAAWRAAQGEAIERHAQFEALQAHFRKMDANVWGWPAWPYEYRDPASPDVAAFAAAQADAVSYYAWLQWQADLQLAAAKARATESGMAVGIYQDLAIGANPGGAEAWRWQQVFMSGAYAGAPPDEINSMGQDWGLPPFVPHRLREAAYVPFVEILRANMKHAGALRIDHVMGLMRMFCVPADVMASEGAYVHYPFEDLLGIVALESQRNNCLVIGEDLGTVPPGFRERLAEAGVLSYHPMIFERYEDGQFSLPPDMPAHALVAVSTHDLPTLRGFWRGVDLDARTQLHLFPTDELRQRMTTERDWDRGRLLWALERTGLLPEGVGKDPAALPELPASAVAAVHAYLARSPAQMLVVQAEDLLDVLEQPNLPGTLEDQHPNWQRKLPLPLEAWTGEARLAAILGAVRQERPQ
jgi:(1->4)-alpha-D-glucan 1-alpha-D-glucosylmutase